MTVTAKFDTADIGTALRRRLQEISREHQQIVAEAQQIRAGATSVTDFAEDGAMASESEQDDLLASRLLRQADQLNEALARIEAGTYGTCQECGEQIAAPRLKALPHATCCLGCQERQERRLR
jgi:DnaK suppressor protein